MRISQHPKFKKSFKIRVSSNKRLAEEYREALQLFLENPKSPVLKDHALAGSMFGYRSFKAANDLLIVYWTTKEGIVLYDIGSHNQVYSK